MELFSLLQVRQFKDSARRIIYLRSLGVRHINESVAGELNCRTGLEDSGHILGLQPRGPADAGEPSPPLCFLQHVHVGHLSLNEMVVRVKVLQDVARAPKPAFL